MVQRRTVPGAYREDYCPILAWHEILQSWVFSVLFCIQEAPNVFNWWKAWTAGRPVQQPNSSTVKPCCCQRCSMQFSIVLLRYETPSLKKTSSGWEHAAQYWLCRCSFYRHLCTTLSSVMQAVELSTDNKLEGPFSLQSMVKSFFFLLKFRSIWPQNSFPLYHRSF